MQPHHGKELDKQDIEPAHQLTRNVVTHPWLLIPPGTGNDNGKGKIWVRKGGIMLINANITSIRLHTQQKSPPLTNGNIASAKAATTSCRETRRKYSRFEKQR